MSFSQSFGKDIEVSFRCDGSMQMFVEGSLIKCHRFYVFHITGYFVKPEPKSHRSVHLSRLMSSEVHLQALFSNELLVSGRYISNGDDCLGCLGTPSRKKSFTFNQFWSFFSGELSYSSNCWNYCELV